MPPQLPKAPHVLPPEVARMPSCISLAMWPSTLAIEVLAIVGHGSAPVEVASSA